MLKGKALTILISTISLFVGLASAAVGATFAWYSTHTAETTQMELNANGVLVVLFDDEPVEFTGELKPAVVANNYTASGLVENSFDQGTNTAAYDVLHTSANISEAATTATATTYFSYLNSSAVDPELAGTIDADVTIYCTAKLILPGDVEKPLSLTRDIAVIPTFSIIYGNDSPIAVANPAFGTPFAVDGDCRIAIGVTIYLLQPDDLTDPDLLRYKSLVINVGTLVEPEEDD